MKKLWVIAIATCVLSAWFNVNVIWADESPTRTYYNNKIPYKALFQSYSTNQLNVQVQDGQKKVQAVIPVVNDEEKDLTQTKGN
jgi:hypothetical protein